MDSQLFSTLVIAAIIGLVPAVIAHRKGRGFYSWWAFGALLFIVALPAAFLLKTNTAELERRQLDSGEMKRCPFCAELIKREAVVCRYCGRSLTPGAPGGPQHTE